MQRSHIIAVSLAGLCGGYAGYHSGYQMTSSSMFNKGLNLPDSRQEYPKKILILPTLLGTVLGAALTPLTLTVAAGTAIGLAVITHQDWADNQVQQRMKDKK